MTAWVFPVEPPCKAQPAMMAMPLPATMYTTGAACALVNAAPWSCVLGKGDLVSGRTYEFRVFARTSTSGLSKMSSIVTFGPIP